MFIYLFLHASLPLLVNFTYSSAATTITTTNYDDNDDDCNYMTIGKAASSAGNRQFTKNYSEIAGPSQVHHEGARRLEHLLEEGSEDIAGSRADQPGNHTVSVRGTCTA